MSVGDSHALMVARWAIDDALRLLSADDEDPAAVAAAARGRLEMFGRYEREVPRRRVSRARARLRRERGAA